MHTCNYAHCLALLTRHAQAHAELYTDHTLGVSARTSTCQPFYSIPGLSSALLDMAGMAQVPVTFACGHALNRIAAFAYGFACMKGPHVPAHQERHQACVHAQGTDESQVAGDNFRAIRPTFSPELNWTAGHSSYELSLSDAESSPCEVFAAAWEKGDHQKWKIVSQHEASQHAKARQVTCVPHRHWSTQTSHHNQHIHSLCDALPCGLSNSAAHLSAFVINSYDEPICYVTQKCLQS